MKIDTKKVAGRRKLHFDSLDEVASDAERLAASPNTRVLGNWPLDRLIGHLAMAINGSIDGISAKAPWYIRTVSPLFKKRFLTHSMSPGFNLPTEAEAKFYPSSGSPQEAAKKLRAAVDRLKTERMTSPHPVFGHLTHDEWLQLHLRHAELHLSYAVTD